MAAKAKAVDWEAVEMDVRAGVLTFAQMAEKHGVSGGRIAQVKKAKGWTRDLSKKIEARTEEKLNAAVLNGKLNAKRKVTEEAIVEATSTLQASTLLGHQKELKALKQTVVALAGELAAVSHGALQDALELVLDEKSDGASEKYKAALTKAFNAALALGGRSNAARNLVASLATLIDKERQAFGIDKDSGDRKSLGEFLDALA